MTGKGHGDIAEWNETTSEEDLSRIAREFDELIKRGHSAFLAESGLSVKKFERDIKEDFFLVAAMAGG